MTDEAYMEIALEEAKLAWQEDEVPVGAVLVRNGEIIARSHNQKEHTQNPLHHAEILCIEEGSRKLNSWRLDECTLYVTLEPCCMCAGALQQARIGRIVYGASDSKGGFIKSKCEMYEIPGLNHKPGVTSGILQSQCSQILSDYFKTKRNRQKK